jgi:cell division protein FtsW
MLIVKKGDQLRRLTKGVLPFFVVIGLLDVLAALEPDLSVAMLYTLLLAVLLFAGGVRIAHSSRSARSRSRCSGTRSRRCSTRFCASRRSSIRARRRRRWATSSSSRSSPSAPGGLFGVGFGQGRQQYGFLPFPYSDFIASNIGEEWGFLGLAAVTLAFAAYALLGFRIARQARSPSSSWSRSDSRSSR